MSEFLKILTVLEVFISLGKIPVSRLAIWARGMAISCLTSSRRKVGISSISRDLFPSSAERISIISNEVTGLIKIESGRGGGR